MIDGILMLCGYDCEIICSFLRQVNSFTRYCGTSGDKKGIVCAYKLIDLIVTRRVVDEFSWTGISKKVDEKKLAFNVLDKFQEFFHKVVHEADVTWSITASSDTLKSIVKYSKRRVQDEGKRL